MFSELNLMMSIGKTATGTGFIYNDEVIKHFCIWIPEFSERPERITLPYKRCQELELVERCVWIESCTGTKDQALLQHSEELIQRLIDSENFDEDQLKSFSEKYDSIYFNQHTNLSAWIALGCTVKLVDKVLQDEIRNGFALVRPPGHHAMYDEFCGYCYLNNVGVAAAHALSKGVERILLVDWDVHHGQATQYSYYEDPRVLYFSIHRYEHGIFWPHLRESDYDYVGKGAGAGYNINVPLNQMGLGTEDYIAIFNHILMPVAYEFDPQLVLVSSGYDAAFGCPEGQMKVLPAAYAHFIHMLSALAHGNVCIILEGGYCLTSLAEGVALSLRELLGDPCPNIGPLPPPSDSITETILNVIKVQRPYWQRLRNQEYLQASEKCIYEEVNVMPPRPGVIHMTEKNRPDRYELELYSTPEDESQIIEEELKQLKETTILERPPKRTGACFEPNLSEFTELYNRSENNQCLSMVLPLLHQIEVGEKCESLLNGILSGEIQNGIFIPQPSINAGNKIRSLINFALDKHKIERLLLLDLSHSPNMEKQKTFMNDKCVLYLSIHSHGPTQQMDNPTEGLGFSISLSPQVDSGIIAGDEEYLAVFHEIVLPVAYQFGPQLVMVTASLSDKKQFALTPQGFSHLIHLLTCLAGGKVLFIVEDGARIDARWDNCVASCVSTLLGKPLEPLKLGKIQDSTIAAISAAQKTYRVNWECLKFQEKIPRVVSTES